MPAKSKATVKMGSKKVTPKTAAKIRKKPGMSNAGKYKNVKADNFAGPNGTFPINTEARARNALARAAQTGDKALITKVKRAVANKYPGIKQGKKS